jgi:Tfp pilus assembly protein PilF
MKSIPHYCQNCGVLNQLGERNCRSCGTRLMLVIFPPAIRHDESIVPSFYEDHLLERVTLLEIRLSQVAERLAMALDLMLRQTKTTHSDHLLLETLIDSLNTLGAVEKDKLTHSWRERVKTENENEAKEDTREKLLKTIVRSHDAPKADLLEHLVKESFSLLEKNEEKQAIRTLERALTISPENISLMRFLAKTFFRADKFAAAVEILEKAQKIAPEDSLVALFLSALYADSLEIKKARKTFEAVDTKKAKFCVNYIYGMLAAYECDWKTALTYFKETLSALDIPEAHYLIACVYFQLAKPKLALRHLQKSVEVDTNYADAWFMLGLIYEMQGDETKSYQSYELAWSSRETGAQCLEFLQRKDKRNYEIALPFIRLQKLKNHLLTGGVPRLSKLFRAEFYKVLN